MRYFLQGAMVVLVCSAAAGQAPQSTATDDQRSALLWLDRFAKEQVLFHEEDVKKLRAKVAAMSPDEASRWWKEHAAHRDALDNPRWQETQNWLREFLRVQARYSDEEIRNFQSEAFAKGRESAESLSGVLEKLIQYRQQFRAAAQGSAAVQQLQLEANQAFRQEQVRQREARWNRPAAQFNSVQPAPPPPRTANPPPPPLIDALDVARWTVLNQVFPRW